MLFVAHRYREYSGDWVMIALAGRVFWLQV